MRYVIFLTFLLISNYKAFLYLNHFLLFTGIAVIVYNNCGKRCMINRSNANRSNAGNPSNYAVSAAVIIAQITVANEEGESVSFSNSYKP